ncbi:MAG: MBL fold metallo-hydrolase [Gammaproteobacteria bacterium]|nr:MBL fold metallo-hydrolase [Gammaproteobacteria bacterium]MCZ6717161.1 MBL fold metallo-hydrolase [Gammaproteobacteria bacterium]
MKNHKRLAGMIVAGVCFLLPGMGVADSLPLVAVTKANEIIDAALEAYGGAEVVSNLKTLEQDSVTIGFALNQSRKPEPPWDKTTTESMNAIEFESELFVTRNKGTANGFEFDNGTIINGENSYQLNFRANTATSIPEPDFDTTSGPFIRITPILLVKQLQERRQTSHWLGEVDIDGRAHDVITLVMEVGPALSLYFDQDSHLLTRSERVLPPFGSIGYRFNEYESIDGIPFNREFELYVIDDLTLQISIKSTRINNAISHLAAVSDDLEKVAAVTPDGLSMNELDNGVYLIGGTGTYAMFVEMEDYVVAIGGTAGIPERIAELRKVVPSKPIRYGVLTHHHNDHVLGVAAYAEENATILTVAENESVVRAAAGDAEDLKLEFVKGSRTIGDGTRRVEIHDIGPTPHVEHLLIAYLPSQGIIFEADHFPLPQTGPIPPAIPNTEAFANALTKKNFNVEKIVGAHSPRIASREDLDRSLKQ